MSNPVDERRRRKLGLDESGLPINSYQAPIDRGTHRMEDEQYYSSEGELEGELEDEELYDPEMQEMGGEEESGEEYEEEMYEPEMYEEMGEGLQQRAEVEQPRAQAEQVAPPQRAQAPAEPQIRSQAEQLPPQRVAQEHMPQRSQAEYQPPQQQRTSSKAQQRLPPHVNTAQSNRRRQVVLGLNEGPTPSIKSPLYRTSSSKAPQTSSARPSKLETARAPHTPVVNGRAPQKLIMPASQQPTAAAPAPTVVPPATASGHGQTTNRVEEFDYGMTPTEDVTFSGSFDLIWNVTGAELAQDPQRRIFTLSQKDLEEIFRVTVINPDEKLTNPNAYNDKDMDRERILLKQLILRGVTQNTGAVLDIMADDQRLKFLNNHWKPGKDRHCMLSIGAKAKAPILGGDNGLVLLDNSSFINTKAFRTFGHTSVPKFMQDIEYPTGEEQRLTIKKGSQLAKMIRDNQETLKAHFIRYDPIMESTERGYLCHSDVVAEALRRYQQHVSPLMRGIIDARHPFKFELWPGIENTWGDAINGSLANYASSTIQVHAVFEVVYCFPESAERRYRMQTAMAPVVDVRAQFHQQLRDQQLIS